MKTQKLECKFLKKECVLGIEHEYCQNAEMQRINKIENSKPLSCIGRKCGCAQYDEHMDSVQKIVFRKTYLTKGDE